LGPFALENPVLGPFALSTMLPRRTWTKVIFLEELRLIYLTQPCFPKDFEPFAMGNNVLNPFATTESCSKNYTIILMNDYYYYFWMKAVHDEDLHGKKIEPKFSHSKWE
jgi:hypothetical protein